MWITKDVDLPPELIEAHANSELVIFVGAGASIGQPSNLPSFAALARQLADAARVPFNKQSPLDRFLGSMPSAFETHAHAARIISHPESSFNSTHLALVKLSAALGDPRIVTTNFDNHLATALESLSLSDGDKWIGPALPLGNDFSGIVHLHGSILRPPRQLVLTDRDFGRAYLTDAWATRFLQRMFDRFTVLFVGYSHDDPIMGYLALGLPSDTRRYVLTPNPNDEKWYHLGITPVSYPAAEGDHSALLSALEAWDRQVRMGRLDHETRMREIVESGALLNPVDEDYVRLRLRSVDGAREFTQFASSVQWLKWAEKLESFANLFSGGAEVPISSTLADWFGRVFVADPDLHGAALQVVQRLGQRFSPELYRSLSWAAESLSKIDAEAGRRWMTILATSIHGVSAPPDLAMLLPYDLNNESDDLALVRVELRTFLSLKPVWTLGDENLTSLPQAEVTWHASEQVLTRHVLALVASHPSGDAALGAALEDALGSANDLLSSYQGKNGFDALAFHRSSIDLHPQDAYRDPVDAVIDGLRDYGVKASAERSDLVMQWWGRGAPLFRRLALHVLTKDSERSANSKLQWLLDMNVLFDFDVKHEVFALLKHVVVDVDEDLKGRLLAEALIGPHFPDDLADVQRHETYTIYNLFVWLTSCDPQWDEARRERVRLEAENPDFGPREFPDLDTWSSGVVIGEALPMEIDSFLSDLEEDASHALTKLLEVDYSERRIDGPTWHSALQLIRQATERRPGLGVGLWGALGISAVTDEKRDHIRNALIDGWAEAELSTFSIHVIGLIAEQVQKADFAGSLARFLATQITKNLDTPENPFIGAMRNLACAVWQAQAGTFEMQVGSPPSSLALNSWPGNITQYWLREVNRRWRELGSRWTGLNETESQAIVALLTDSIEELNAVRPAIGRQAYFLFAADAEFAKRQVLPLFDGPQSYQAWEPYLHSPRYNEQMLSSEFLQSIISQWRHLGDYERHGLQQQFLVLVVSIISVSSIERDRRQALLDQSVLAGDGVFAAAFASTVLRFVLESSIDGATLWESWLRAHVSARLDGLPRNAQAAELERWADLAPYMGRYADEAMALLSGRGIALGDDYHVPDWPPELLATYGSEVVLHVANRIKVSAPTGWKVPHAVREVIDDLTRALGEEACRPLVEAAVEAGFTRLR